MTRNCDRTDSSRVAASSEHTLPLRFLRRIARRDGTSAVEFALLGPVFCLLIAGLADFGGAVYVKLGLDGCVSAASNYALTSSGQLTTAAGPALAANLATLISSSQSTNWADAAVVLNNGPSANVVGGAASLSGTVTNIASCYCPTIGSTVAWGAPVLCGVACPNGSLAGKFVTLVASRSYSAIFSSYGIVQNGVISASSVVQVQ